MKPVRVRFAPSPTGYLHIGGARTAIFNWLLARHFGGSFLLRIEDTDRERSKAEYEEDILDALRWLGLEWDEEPLRQSTRRSYHREVVEELIERGAAYRDFLPPGETDRLKKEAQSGGRRIAFRGPDRDLDPAESLRRAEAGEPFAVRMKVPDHAVSYVDGVHGGVRVEPDAIDDFVLMRRDGTPTYMVAVVADDFEMGITHVIRGDDHISNTPKQILLYTALGWTPPAFAHVPLILGPDKKRLSKRHGATALTEYRRRGYLPEAMLSYLALLGWSPGDDRELLSREELIEAFSIEGINNRSAVFDERKLEWMNGQFLSLLPDEEIIRVLRQPVADRVAAGILPHGSGLHLPTAVRLLKTRSRFPLEILERGSYFFKDPEEYDPAAAKKRLKDPETPERLEGLADLYEKAENFDEATLETILREYAESLGIGGGKLIHATRIAVSGQGVGPGLFELLAALGRETVVRRMRKLADHLRRHGTPPTKGTE
ncbi:MAG TPA: glutamate--tRNA ligase [Bacteroidetes bacterium]|nr:glutamate--tRNA ligase [Bacteroidota bacterium]